jgi:hypothetical protein
MEEAKARLRHAIDLDNGIRKLALDDEDLKPLWDWIGGLSAGRGGWPKPRSLQLLAMHSKRC